MIPVIIQKRGAVHLTDEAEEASLVSPLPPPPAAVLELVPAAVARQNVVFPLRLEGETLYVAAADPNNLLVADQLSFIVNKRIRFVAYPRRDILAAIDRHYGRPVSSVDSYLTEFTDTAVAYTTTDTAHRARLAVAAPAMSPPARASALAKAKGRKSAGGNWRALAAADEDDSEFELSLAEGAPGRAPMWGEEQAPNYGTETMWFYTVEEGHRALRVYPNGRMEIVVGPARVWKGWSRFERMRHFVAHPGEFLIVRFRDGQQDHLPGPCDIWFDPRIHQEITRQDALQLAAKEAVIVYTRAGDTVKRRIVYGPSLFVPAPGEWLHTFQWHGSDGGSQGQKKVAKGLVFQKLWLMPDQMYHDVHDVRTADDAVLTMKLMVFFELTDIERMLEETHDPIGDFINAATSDVVDFTGRRTFDQFKQETGLLNELETYRQLTARAAQNGYRINKVVYRGYGAPDRLQAMHDQAIEARTKLQLERATEEQSQNLEDFKLNAMMNRAARRRTEQSVEVETELELARRRQEAELRQKEAERTAAREQRRLDADSEQEIRRQSEERTRLHLQALKDMGVDLTAYLTQGRADRVIELRGGKGNTHVHLGSEAERNGE